VNRQNSHRKATQLVSNVFCYLKREAENSGSVQAVAKREKLTVNACDVEKFAAPHIYIVVSFSATNHDAPVACMPPHLALQTNFDRHRNTHTHICTYCRV
jgi:hypothetical protein